MEGCAGRDNFIFVAAILLRFCAISAARRNDDVDPSNGKREQKENRQDCSGEIIQSKNMDLSLSLTLPVELAANEKRRVNKCKSPVRGRKRMKT